MLIDIHYPAPAVSVMALTRPEAANALNIALSEALAQAFEAIPPTVRAVVITGAGTRAFCAGADLKEREGMDETAWERQHAALRGARDAVLHAPVPVIAAVNGAAFGGGLELALAADFIYAADTARFALTEAKLGIMPGLGGVQLLASAIGERRARDMLLTGRALDAENAYEWGLVNQVFPAEALLPAAIQAAQSIADNAPLSIRAIRHSLRETTWPRWEALLSAELAEYKALLTTADRHEGISAFNAKRKPQFKGN